MKVRDLTEIAMSKYRNKYLLLEEKKGKIKILYVGKTFEEVYRKAKEKGIKNIYIKKGGVKDNPFIFY